MPVVPIVPEDNINQCANAILVLMEIHMSNVSNEMNHDPNVQQTLIVHHAMLASMNVVKIRVPNLTFAIPIKLASFWIHIHCVLSHANVHAI